MVMSQTQNIELAQQQAPEPDPVRRGLLPVCGNPACPGRGSLWRAISNRRLGILFQNKWYCQADCLEQVLNEQIERLVPVQRTSLKAHRMPLGLLLLSAGTVRDQDLRSALRAQRESGRGRLGEWLRKLGAATEQQVTAAIGQQWSRPVYPLALRQSYLPYQFLIPIAILERSRMVVVHVAPVSGLMHVAFESRIDHTTLYAVEQMLGCRTETCIADQSAIDQALDQMRQQPRLNEFTFDDHLDWEQIARITRSYASKLSAEHIRMVTCSEFMWLHLDSPAQKTHLVFRIPCGTAEQTAIQVDQLAAVEVE